MHRVLALLVLVALCAGAAPSGAASRTVDMLETYEPVLFFHSSEDWAPEPVETFLADARLEKQVAKGSWKTVSGPVQLEQEAASAGPDD